MTPREVSTVILICQILSRGLLGISDENYAAENLKIGLFWSKKNPTYTQTHVC